MGLFDFWKQPVVEVKESAVASIIYETDYGQARWTKSDYENQAKAAYQENPVAYKCIQEIAKACATVPIKTFNGETESLDNPLIQLLNQPNPQMTWVDFVMAIKIYQKIGGEVFIEAVKGGGQVKELWVHRPDRIRKKTSSRGIEAFVFEIDGREKTFKVDRLTGLSDEILHISQLNPLDDFYGMSSLKPAAYSIDLFNGMQEHQKKFLDNGCRPSGYLKAEGMDESTAQSIKQNLQNNYAGPSNSGKPMVIGGMEWQQAGLTPQEMDWLNSKNAVARDIAMTFGVPSQLLGIPGDSTYNNVKEARLSFYENTVMLEVQKLLMELNKWLAPRFGSYTIEADWNAVPAIAEKKEMLFTMLKDADYLTDNEKREMLGFEPIDGGDELTEDEVTDMEDNDESTSN